MNQFTPGPWYPVNYSGFINLQPDEFYGQGNNLLDQAEYKNAVENGQLAAAAPTMYDLLKRLYKRVNHNDYPDLCEEIIDVLNKANPKQEND